MQYGGLVKHSFLELCVVLSFSFGVICWIYFGWPDSFPTMRRCVPKLHSTGWYRLNSWTHLTKKGRNVLSARDILSRNVQKAHQRNPWGILLTGIVYDQKGGDHWFVSSHWWHFPTICQKHIDGFRNPANIWFFYIHVYHITR